MVLYNLKKNINIEKLVMGERKIKNVGKALKSLRIKKEIILLRPSIVLKYIWNKYVEHHMNFINFNTYFNYSVCGNIM